MVELALWSEEPNALLFSDLLKNLMGMQAALDPSSAARRCADEAIRIFSPSIDVRFAARDLTLPCTALGTAHHRRSSGGDSRGSNGSASEESYDSKPSLSRTSPTVPSNSPGVQVKKGDMLAVAPFLVHRDKRLFPSNPGKFNPTPSVPSHDSRPRTPSPGITEGHAEHNGRAANSGMGGSGNSLRCSSSLEAIPGISGAGISFGGGNYRCISCDCITNHVFSMVCSCFLLSLQAHKRTEQPD